VYCVLCGSENPAYGKYCHNCGKRLLKPTSSSHRGITPRIPTEQELLVRLLKTSPKPNECHRCGTEADLTRHQFAIAKVVSVKREWGETIARFGLSAVSIATAPVTGFGVLSWKAPNKATSYKLLKAELVLCRSCLSWAWKAIPVVLARSELKADAYRCHPWAEKARRIGYDKFLSAEQVAKLTPVRERG